MVLLALLINIIAANAFAQPQPQMAYCLKAAYESQSAQVNKTKKYFT
jgi:hypothetical protein